MLILRRFCNADNSIGKSKRWCGQERNGGQPWDRSCVRQGKKVLLVDADSQGNLTEMLGWQQPDKLEHTLSNLLEKVICDEPLNIEEGILYHEEGVDLIPSNIELSGMEVVLVNAMSRETVLRTYLNEIKRQYAT